MRRRASLILSSTAVCLLLAAFTFAFVIATGPAEATGVHVGAVFLSNALIAAVLIQLLVRLYGVTPWVTIVWASLFAFAIGLESVAVLVLAATLSSGLAMLHPLFLARDLPGAMLFYVCGSLLAVAIWRSHRPAALLLGSSAALLAIALPIGIVAPVVGACVTALSIVTYATAYSLFPDVAERLANQGGVHPHVLGHVGAGSFAIPWSGPRHTLHR